MAHGLAEQLVMEKITDGELENRLGDVVTCDGFEIEIDEDMIEAVVEYRDLILEDMGRLKETRGSTPVVAKAEVRLNADSVDPDLWGTTDFLLYKKGKALRVYDFKYGKGVVEAEENAQMGCYAVAAMDSEAGEAFDEVELIIHQPRARHADGAVRRWKTTVAWVRAFRVELKAAVFATKQPNAPLLAGDHCKWCPAKAVCPALFGAAQRSAVADFSLVAPTETKEAIKGLPDVRQMSLEKLALALNWQEAVESWFSAIKDLVQEKLNAGEDVPGWKLVEGRSNRKWADEERVVAELSLLKDEGALFEHKLLSPAKMEKLFGKKGSIDHLTFKPEPKKAIARDTDPRRAVARSAQADFDPLRPEVKLTGTPSPLADPLAELSVPEPLTDPLAPVVQNKRKPIWPA